MASPPTPLPIRCLLFSAAVLSLELSQCSPKKSDSNRIFPQRIRGGASRSGSPFLDFLTKHDLNPLESRLRKFGVESLSDVDLLEESDAADIGITKIQIRKLLRAHKEEAYAQGEKADLSDSGAEETVISQKMSRMSISGREPTADKNKKITKNFAAAARVEASRPSGELAAGHQSQSHASTDGIASSIDEIQATLSGIKNENYRVLHAPKSNTKDKSQNTSDEDSSGNPTNARIAWPEKLKGNHDEALAKFLKRQERMGVELTDEQRELLVYIKKQKIKQKETQKEKLDDIA